MKGESKILYLRHQQIDKAKWDKCIDAASNGLIYAYSFYLDCMAKNWDALVMSDGSHSENEYKMVMPLTWNEKFGFAYLYQPFLVAQTGIFGNNITKEQVSNFIANIPSSFRLIEISLNKNNTEGLPANSVLRNNYVLDLTKTYDHIYQHYRENIQRNIKKSIQLGCTVQKDIAVEKIIALAIQQMKLQGNSEDENVNRFRTLYNLLQAKKMAATYGIISAQNELLASCVFFFSHGRAYYILVGNHPNGKNSGASPALIDAFIKEFAGKNLPDGHPAKLLDFEGSDIPGLAHYYSSFGAVQENYPAVKLNRLPFYLKWLKK